MTDLTTAIKRLRNRRGSDMRHIVAEMIKYADAFVYQALLDAYNKILTDGTIPDDWHVTVFTMLPKHGNLNDASNWRPIAILPILYKIFSRMIYNRLQPILESHQSDDQFGFRPKRRIDNVFTILENVIGKSNEWNLPLWMISLDLRKAFDRIEFVPLFNAIRAQNIPDAYIQLLAALYQNQTGSANGSDPFLIQRGVKQGDVISPMLFNAGLEIAFRRWKTRLHTHGFKFKNDGTRFTNTRYADDVLIFAKSLDELMEMMEMLVEELATIGLTLNGSKTKILTN